MPNEDFSEPDDVTVDDASVDEPVDEPVDEAEDDGEKSGKKKRKVKTGAKLLAQERMRRAVELRKAGATYDQIAKSVGYRDSSGARKAIIRAMDQVLQEPAAEMRQLQIERCNHMLMTLWPKVQQGDERAIDSSLRIMDKMDRYTGTEGPQRIDITSTHTDAVMVIEGDKDDYITAMKRLAGIAGDGTNIPQQIEAAAQNDMVIDAEVVDDEVVGVTVEAPAPTPAPAAAPAPKKFEFGVNPTISKET